MKSIKAIPVALVGAALLVACESTPSAPDVDATPSAVSGQDSALTTTRPSFNRGNGAEGRGKGALGVVFVESQQLYYETFVTAKKLPPQGPFQLLVNGVTEYGPGDPGYLGGRWKVPNGSGGYDYFLCPLLPPGFEKEE